MWGLWATWPTSRPSSQPDQLNKCHERTWKKLYEFQMEICTLSHAMQLHAQLIKGGSNGDDTVLSRVFTFSALSPSGCISYARSIFDSLHTSNSYFFNTLLRGYANCHDPQHALRFFVEICSRDHAVRADKFSYPFLLKSCGRLRAVGEGRQLHGLVFKSKLQGDRFVQNSLIHVYSCCGELGCARRVFDEMRERDVVSWTSIIDGYVDCDRPVEALQLFERMQEDKIAANEATIVAVLRACADAGALGIGQRVHGIARRNRVDSRANVMTALINMYAKCGAIECAQRLFQEMGNDKDVFQWTAMISALASHGKCQEAVNLFHQMEEQGIRPDDRTMTAVLSACRNAGWIKEAHEYFNHMEKSYGIRTKVQHYGCMVDLLARAGRLSEAEELIYKMPIEPDVVLLRNLIWACKIHGDTDRGERLMKSRLFEIDSRDSGNYALLENFYASAGKWSEKARVRKLMNQRGIKKAPGCSKIEVNGVIHEFAAGDSRHPEAQKIYEKWEEIKERLKLEGYFPQVSEVLLDIEDEGKAFQLSHHSEKLAVAFGMINMAPRTKILVVKNLRSCEDCHLAMKLISKIYNQEIMIRDRIRFHHFKNGKCSCMDYW